MGVDSISEDAWVLVVGSVDRRLARALGKHVLMHGRATDLVLPRESFELAIWLTRSGPPDFDALVEIRNALARDGSLLVIDRARALHELDDSARNAGFSRRRIRGGAAGFSVLELSR